MELDKLRAQIDEIDSELVALFEKRMEVCKDVALYKQACGKEVFDAQREKSKLSRIAQLSEKEMQE